MPLHGCEARIEIPCRLSGDWLTFGKGNSNLIPETYADSDWAGNLKSQKRTSGYVLLMCGTVIYWCSRRQEVVALSSTKA